MTDADEKVLRLVAHYARENAHNKHLRECPDLVVAQPKAEDGTYGCETGCEYAELTADLSCPHGEAEEFTYGEFGEIAWMLEDLDKM